MKSNFKDFQKILILWSISAIISAIALYNFKDIKFKNTKKLWQEVTQEQEEIIQDYSELLNNQFQENTNIENRENLSVTWNINILLPEFLFSKWLENIWKQLEEKEIYVNFNKIVKLSDYKKDIKSWLKNNDILLLPSDWLKWLNLENINIWENPKPYFHEIFENIVSINENKFIPYSIDPIVNLKKPWIESIESRADLFLYTTLWKQNKKYSMPLIRWFWKNDIRLLERLQEPFENHFITLYEHIKNIKQTKNSSELNNMLDYQSISLDYKYDFAVFKQLYKTIQKRDPNCEKFPAICLLSYNFWDIKFWFISDLDILSNYFSGNNIIFNIEPFFNSQENYPVRWWIFVVPKNNEKILLANEFFKKYMYESIEKGTWIRNNTLPAVNKNYDTFKLDNKYEKIIKYENSFELIYENLNLHKDFINNSDNTNLLKWNYNPKLFLE